MIGGRGDAGANGIGSTRRATRRKKEDAGAAATAANPKIEAQCRHHAFILSCKIILRNLSR